MPSARGALVAITVVALGSTAAVGADPAGADRVAGGSPSRSHPFAVAAVPPDYVLTTAGVGTQVQWWGDDFYGNDGPYTVLTNDRKGQEPRKILVSVGGFGANEGGLSQASQGYQDPRVDRFRIDGRRAIYTPPGIGVADNVRSGWAELVAVRGHDLAVFVKGRDVPRKLLTEVLHEVHPVRDHADAPRILNPPHGWRVTGRLDAEALVPLKHGFFLPDVPGTRADHGAGWQKGSDLLAVVSAPASTGDLTAILAAPPLLFWRQIQTHETRAGGLPAAVVDSVGPDAQERVVATHNASGNLVLVIAHGLEVPSEQVLIDLAASVEPTDDATWTTFVEAAGDS